MRRLSTVLFLCLSALSAGGKTIILPGTVSANKNFEKMRMPDIGNALEKRLKVSLKFSPASNRIYSSL